MEAVRTALLAHAFATGSPLHWRELAEEAGLGGEGEGRGDGRGGRGGRLQVVVVRRPETRPPTSPLPTADAELGHDGLFFTVSRVLTI